VYKTVQTVNIKQYTQVYNNTNMNKYSLHIYKRIVVNFVTGIFDLQNSVSDISMIMHHI